MKFEEKRDALTQVNEDALLADGFEDALIGYVSQFNKTVALYDRAKCIQILMKDGLTESDAEEFFEFNTQGACVGENTPAFAVLFEPAQPEEPRVDSR